LSFVVQPQQTLTRIHRLRMSSSSSTSSSSSSSSSSVQSPETFENVLAVIFDIDGTLADSWKLGFDASVAVLKNNQLPTITEEVYHEHTIYATPPRLARHAGLTPDDQDFEEVGNRLAAEFDDLYVGLVTAETAGFYPGVGPLLERIAALAANDNKNKQVKLACLTNACAAYAHAVLKANSASVSFYEKFHSIHGADTVPSPKPDPEGLWQVCKELGVSPANAVYVGDSPGDGKAAHAAGMPSIGVTWGSHSEESLRNSPFSHICSSVDELCKILNL